MTLRQRTQSGEVIPQATLDASARSDAEVKAVYAAVRANEDSALKQSLDALETTLTDLEKCLGL
jgi:hypothetical protein